LQVGVSALFSLGCQRDQIGGKSAKFSSDIRRPIGRTGAKRSSATDVAIIRWPDPGNKVPTQITL
jgi:hypothetical protein